MRSIPFALALMLAAGPAGALTVHTAPFITTVTNFTGFEGLGPIFGGDGVTSYSEDGINVDYVGSGAIWSTAFSPAPEGLYTWYPDGSGIGYTRFTFAPATGFQLLVSSGWFTATVSLAYEVLLGGVSIGSGIAGPAPNYLAGFVTYGFSGATFDEVRLQVTGLGAFDPGAIEAGAYDSVTIGTSDPVRAPAALALFGLALSGLALRRR